MISHKILDQRIYLNYPVDTLIIFHLELYSFINSFVYLSFVYLLIYTFKKI